MVSGARRKRRRRKKARSTPPTTSPAWTLGDCYLPIPELSRYSGFSKRALRQFTLDPTDPLPSARNGAPGCRGHRGPKIVVKRSDFDAWIARRQQHRQQPPADLGRVLDQAVREVGAGR